MILGGGHRGGDFEYLQYKNQDIGVGAMESVRYGLTLAKATHSDFAYMWRSDTISTDELIESDLTQKILKDEFQIQARWIENRSTTTELIASFSGKALKQEGGSHIYLATHFWHVPRAQVVFEKHGLKLTPAPMGFYQRD